MSDPRRWHFTERLHVDLRRQASSLCPR
ncbi:putative leader peptide [Solihabitans fulvus]